VLYYLNARDAIVSGFGFLVSGFWFRVSGFGFRVSGFGFRLWGSFGRADEIDSLIDNLLVRIRFIIVIIRWTGLARWESEFPFAGSLTSTFLVHEY
jgi:hypothetical protein